MCEHPPKRPEFSCSGIQQDATGEQREPVASVVPLAATTPPLKVKQEKTQRERGAWMSTPR